MILTYYSVEYVDRIQKHVDTLEGLLENPEKYGIYNNELNLQEIKEIIKNWKNEIGRIESYLHNPSRQYDF